MYMFELTCYLTAACHLAGTRHGQGHSAAVSPPGMTLYFTIIFSIIYMTLCDLIRTAGLIHRARSPQ